MPQEMSRAYGTGAKVTGVFMILCGGSIVILACRLVMIMEGLTGSAGTSSAILVFGFWSGIPLIITGAVGLAAGVKCSRDLMIAFMVPCVITFVVAMLQTISAGIAMEQIAPQIEKALGSGLDGECPEGEKYCDTLRTILGCYIGFVIAGVVACISSLAGSIVTYIFYRTTTQLNHVPLPAAPGVVMTPPPYLPALGATQVTSSMQHSYVAPEGPSYQVNPGFPQQSNYPPTETTQDNVMLTA